MPWRRLVLTCICWLSIGLWIGSSFLGGSPERRFILYSIIRELKPGMAKSEAEAVVQRHQAPFIDYHETPNGMVVGVRLLPIKYLDLYMHFDQDKLVNAGLITDDGPDNLPRDAPKFE